MSKHYTHIRDGFTRSAYIEPQPSSGRNVGSLHGELRFSYRPMLPEERDTVRRLVLEAKGNGGEAMLNSALADHLVSWSAVDDRGNAVPVTVDGVRRLPPPLHDRVYLIISGGDAGDPDPNATIEEESAYAARLRKAAESGAAVGDAQTVEQQKN